jgi:hypothetical protein
LSVDATAHQFKGPSQWSALLVYGLIAGPVAAMGMLETTGPPAVRLWLIVGALVAFASMALLTLGYKVQDVLTVDPVARTLHAPLCACSCLICAKTTQRRTYGRCL